MRCPHACSKCKSRRAGRQACCAAALPAAAPPPRHPSHRLEECKHVFKALEDGRLAQAQPLPGKARHGDGQEVVYVGLLAHRSLSQQQQQQRQGSSEQLWLKQGIS